MSLHHSFQHHSSHVTCSFNTLKKSPEQISQDTTHGINHLIETICLQNMRSVTEDVKLSTCKSPSLLHNTLHHLVANQGISQITKLIIEII